MNTRYLALYIGLILLAFNTYSQEEIKPGAKLKKANALFSDMKYREAIPLYAKVLKKEPENYSATQNLAHCYRLTFQFDQAEIFYKKALALPDPDPSMYLYYGQVLKSNKKYDQAKDVFLVYSTNNPEDPHSKQHVMSLDKMVSWGNKYSMFMVDNVKSINSSGSEFSPFFFNNELVFVSDRSMDHYEKDMFVVSQHNYMSVFYTFNQGDTVWSEPKLFSFYINDDHHNGPISFNKSGEFCAFTRVSDLRKGPKHINRPQIFLSRFSDEERWEPAVPFQFNSMEYALAHPALSPDGKTLVFTSDMPGGLGGKDLYVSYQNSDGSWTKPANLGPSVNSFNNELFPYIHEDGSLYFSSDGHAGYGGLDIFSAKKRGKTWGFVENLKAPLNSHHDDFGITFKDNSTGYFSSNRKGGKGSDDIYSFTKMDKADDEITTSVSGVFLYSNLSPAQNQKIKVLDAMDNILLVVTTDENGEFEIPDIPVYEDFRLEVADPELIDDNARIFLLNEEGEHVEELRPTPSGVFAFSSLPFDEYNSMPPVELAEDVQLSAMTIMGQLYQTLPGDLPPGLEVLVLDDKGNIIYSTVTDNEGKFYLKNMPPNKNIHIKLKEENPDAHVYLIDRKGEMVEEVLQSDNGEYDYRLLPPDKYKELNMLLAEDAVPETYDLKGQLYNIEPGDIRSKRAIELVDQEGNIVASSETDKEGNFIFKSLAPESTFYVRLKKKDKDVKLMIYDESGVGASLAEDNNGDFEYSYLTRDEAVLRKLNYSDDSKMASKDFSGQLYQKLPGDIPAGMEVVLVNDKGEIIMTTKTDENGNFDFRQLPPDLVFYVRMKNAPTDVKMITYDEEGTGSRAKQTESGDFEYSYLKRDEYSMELLKSLDESKLAGEKLSGQFYYNLPGDADREMDVFLINEKGEVVKSAKTDRFGNFVFENLPPDHGYVVHLKKSDPNAKLLVFDKDGVAENVKQNTSGDFNYALLAADKVSINLLSSGSNYKLFEEGLYGQVYNKNPGDAPEGIKVSMIGSKGETISSVATDETGNFNFPGMKMEEGKSLKLEEKYKAFSLLIMNKSGEFVTAVKADGKGEFDYSLLTYERAGALGAVHSVDEARELFTSGFYGQVYQNKPGDGPEKVKIQIVDNASKVIMETETGVQGGFSFDQTPEADYMVKIPSRKDLKIMVTTKEGELVEKLVANNSGDFDFEQLQRDIIKDLIVLESEKDVKKMFRSGIYGQIYKVTIGDGKSGITINMVDESGTVIQKTITESAGGFHFSSMPPESVFYLNLENTRDKYKIVILDENGEFVQASIRNESGDFDFRFLAYDLAQGLSSIKAGDNTKLDLNKGIKGQIYANKLGDGPRKMEVMLVDDNNKLISSTFTDQFGGFAFKNLPSDLQYFVRIKGLSDQSDFKLFLVNENGSGGKTISQNKNGLYNTEERVALLSKKEIAQSKAGLYGQVYLKNPGDGRKNMVIEVLDENLNVVQTVKSEMGGTFSFKELSPDKVYFLRVIGADGTVKVMLLDGSGTMIEVLTQEETSDNTFPLNLMEKVLAGKISVSEKQLSIVSDSKPLGLYGKLVKQNTGALVNDKLIYLKDENGNLISQTWVKNDGSFSFQNLPGEYFMMTVDPNDDEAVILILDKKGRIVDMLDGKPGEDFTLDVAAIKKAENNNSGTMSVVQFFKERELAMQKQIETAENNTASNDKTKSDKMNQKDIVGNETSNENKIEAKNEKLIPVKDWNNKYGLINYEFDKASIEGQANSNLNQVAGLLKENKEVYVLIKAHTDSKGSDEYNLNLSQRRANSARSYLINNGVSSSRIKSTGRGERDPIAPNTKPDGSDNPEGRAKNRRAELIFELQKFPD